MSEELSKRASRRRRRGGLAWISGVVALIAGLLYWEQIETLYLLSVLSLCAFLLVVAFSHLERGTPQAAAATQEANEAAPPVGATKVGATKAAVTPALVERGAAERRHRGAA